jgi:aminoglycoside phosphotransferase (APT) family kinase protein
MTTQPAVPADLSAVAPEAGIDVKPGAVVEPVPAAPSAIRAVTATDSAGQRATEGVRPKTSSRDPKKLHADLTAWLTRVLPDGAAPILGELGIPSGSGMSSETLLFDASWNDGGSRVTTSLVARVAPDPAAAPVFEHYYLDRQYRVIKEVAALTDVPVPNLRWLETDPAALGEPFFVMDRIEGVVPTDLPPYAISGWVAEGSPAERRRLQDASVEVLAKLHAIPDAAERFAFLLPHRTEASSLRQHVKDTRAYYDWTASDGMSSPLIERTFAWLEENWPADEGPAALSWGDSRLGNMMFRQFAPVAVLDWEMAAVGPPELDLAWMAFMHYFFDSMLSTHGLTGLPDMMRPVDLAATYEGLTGYAPRDLRFYLTYSCLRYAIIAFRISRRMLLFGEIEMPDDVDDLVGVRADLSAMLEGNSPLTAPF